MMDSVLNWMQQNKVATGVIIVLVILLIVTSTGWGVSSKSGYDGGLFQTGYLHGANSSGMASYTGANILALKGDGTDDMPGAYSGCAARRAQRAAEEAAKSSKASFQSDSDLAEIATGGPLH